MGGLARPGSRCVLGIRVMSEMENCSKKFPLDHGESPASHSEGTHTFFPVYSNTENKMVYPHYLQVFPDESGSWSLKS